MAEHQDPAYLQGGQHTAQGDRNVLSTMLSSSGGVREDDDLEVTAGTGMTVDVAPGAGWTPEQGPFQGVYHFFSDTVVNLPLVASDPVNDRIDLVVARVYDAAYAGAENKWQLEVVTGVAAATPSEPAVPARSLVLARVDVGAGVSTVGPGDITDYRDAGALNTNIARFVPLAGGTMTGALTLPGNPTNNLHASTKQYVDTRDTGRFVVAFSGGNFNLSTAYTDAASSITFPKPVEWNTYRLLCVITGTGFGFTSNDVLSQLVNQTAPSASFGPIHDDNSGADRVARAHMYVTGLSTDWTGTYRARNVTAARGIISSLWYEIHATRTS